MCTNREDVENLYALSWYELSDLNGTTERARQRKMEQKESDECMSYGLVGFVGYICQSLSTDLK